MPRGVECDWNETVVSTPDTLEPAALTDQQLVDAYRRSRVRGALDELLSRYVEKVRSLVGGIVLDDTLADDVTQETFVRAVRGLESFAGRSRRFRRVAIYQPTSDETPADR